MSGKSKSSRQIVSPVYIKTSQEMSTHQRLLNEESKSNNQSSNKMVPGNGPFIFLKKRFQFAEQSRKIHSMEESKTSTNERF